LSWASADLSAVAAEPIPEHLRGLIEQLAAQTTLGRWDMVRHEQPPFCPAPCITRTVISGMKVKGIPPDAAIN
jgi:hypothetical protein